MPLEVRRVQGRRDFQKLYQLLVEYEQSLPPDLRHGLAPDAQSMRSSYDEPNAAFLAMLDEDLAGCVAVTPLGESTAVMMRLYVRERHRGRGAARRLVTAALAFLRGRRYERVVLDTNKERLGAAYSLYLSLGFKECAPYGDVASASPTFMELFL
jgi:ribosomal protein S18 acetylase RimI-like enzyme